MNRLAIIGGGGWGTALAVVLSPRFEAIRLWVYEPDLAERMAQGSENDLYLPGFRLPGNVEVSSDLQGVARGAGLILSVMPSHLVRGIYEQLLPVLDEQMSFVSATKGLELDTLLLPSQVIEQVISKRFAPRVAAISGPSFAREVAALNPTAIVVAARNAELARCVQAQFSGPSFRLYTSTDVTGIQVGGAIKNVVAIGAGVVHGLGLGHNTTAALVTRGLAEMTRLAVALGGETKTLSGLAGLGDLVLTCTGELSRNRAVGVELARGRRLGEIVGSMKMVAEGVNTTSAAIELARRCSVEMPIAEQMYQMLHFGLEPREAVRRLMERSLREE